MKLDQIFTLECLEREVREPFSEAIYKEYGVTPSLPIPDGQIHRFDIDRNGDKVGWYVLFEEMDFSCAVFGNWRLGDTHKWQSSNNLTEEQHYRLECHMADIEREQKQKQEATAKTAKALYESADAAKEDHPYLIKKKIGMDVYLAQIGDRLVLPVLDEQFNIVSLQYISPDGKKQFLKGGQTSGGFCPIGLTEDYDGPVYMAEGYATAKSVQEATGKPCIVAFNAGNLPKVAEELKEFWSITIVADNDESGTGEKYAKATGLPYKLIPIVGMDANDYAVAGYDLKEFLIPTSEHNDAWLLSADDLLDNYKPTPWLIKNWLSKDGITLLIGKSGCGKSFTLISQLLAISTGQPDWFGFKVKKGNVVYLAGEGFNGIRKRIKLWKQRQNIDSVGNFVISQSALDLDKLEGLQKTVKDIQALPWKPDVIAIDTLNRFFSGDENSSQEARGFIESCTELQRLFQCSIVVVHHTGVSEGAQDRARGSSAFRGAIDTEILVTKDENSFLTLRQTKQKDEDGVADLELRLKGYRIDGWYDEDGEPVTSAMVELPDGEDKKAKIENETHVIEEAYRNSGREHDDDDYPYLSRADLKQYLRDSGKNENNVKAWMRTEPNRPVGKLIQAGIIKANGNGWTICDIDIANALVLDEL